MFFLSFCFFFFGSPWASGADLDGHVQQCVGCTQCNGAGPSSPHCAHALTCTCTAIAPSLLQTSMFNSVMTALHETALVPALSQKLTCSCTATAPPFPPLQTSMFNVKTALNDNEMLMTIDDLLDATEDR